MGLLLGFIALQLYISWHAYCISTTIILLLFQICNAIAISQKLCAPSPTKKTPLGGILTNVWVFQSKHFIIFVVCYLGSIPHWDRGKVTVSKVGIVTSNEPFGLNHLGICQQLLLEDMVNIPIIYRVYYTSQVVGLGISEPSTAVRKPMIVDLNHPFTYLFFF